MGKWDGHFGPTKTFCLNHVGEVLCGHLGARNMKTTKMVFQPHGTSVPWPKLINSHLEVRGQVIRQLATWVWLKKLRNPRKWVALASGRSGVKPAGPLAVRKNEPHPLGGCSPPNKVNPHSQGTCEWGIAKVATCELGGTPKQRCYIPAETGGL